MKEMLNWLRRKGYIKTVACLRSSPQLLASLFAAYRFYIELDSFSTISFVLTDILLLLALTWLWWSWMNYYEEELKAREQS